MINKFVSEFQSITGVKPEFDAEYYSALEKFVDYLGKRKIRSFKERKREFLGHVNWKFRLNAEGLAKFFAAAAADGYTFHYHQKNQIQKAFDIHDKDLLLDVLKDRNLPKQTVSKLLDVYCPISEEKTISHLVNECNEPTKLRREKGDRNIAAEIAKSQFSSFMWVALPEKEMHKFFDPKHDDKIYRESFWEQLHTRAPHLFNRETALFIYRINEQVAAKFDNYLAFRDSFCAVVEESYEQINNHGYLAVLIEPFKFDNKSCEWQLASDVTLYAEKHRESKLEKAYFRWEKVRDDTLAHVSELNVEQAQFDLVNEGFTYKDCFVIGDNSKSISKVLLLFQKNERDETKIPCPTCRSDEVQGNSYSSLGVRSWECNNVLCPDRSKYNRGKRYSFRGLAMQQAINDEHNQILADHVRKWVKDVVFDVEDSDILKMVITHYSMYRDVVHMFNWHSDDFCGRKVKAHNLSVPKKSVGFWEGPFFKRFVTPIKKIEKSPRNNLGDRNFQVLHGDSSSILAGFENNVFDGAVTSPPYYNAREYSQWPNIYCYLHDMYKINSQVFRTLKPGAIYLYNIFDYFDNENSIVFSMMGQKRMILSAYTVDLFRRIGFNVLGNVVWDKGDIEGKRGFNGGNFSPYYQAPFNCWEHILIFQKPGRSKSPVIGSSILQQQPVLKMVNGKNTHGHTAPFPEKIPQLLISKLEKGSVVLDPFGGSLTTGRVAEQYGLRSVCIERSKEYCELGLKLRSEGKKQSKGQMKLFDEATI